MTVKYKELFELIELAEKVSEKTDFYRSKLFNLKIQLVILYITLILSIILTAYYRMFRDFSFYGNKILIPIIFIFLIFIYALLIFRQLSRQKQLYHHEKKNLIRLLEMTNEFKDLYFYRNNDSITVVERAMLEIRLNRINFDE